MKAWQDQWFGTRGDWLLALVPGFECGARELCYQGARDDVWALCEQSKAVVDRCDGAHPLHEIESLPSATDVLADLWEIGALVFQPPRRPVAGSYSQLFISPHADDLALSLGAHLVGTWKRAPVRMIVTCVARSTCSRHHPNGRGPVAEVTRRRRDEDLAFGLRCGAELITLDVDDWPLADVGIAGDPSLLAARVKEFTEQLSPVILKQSPNELWLPAGIGEHPDHLAVALAAKQLLSALPNTLGYVYEDLPYALHVDDGVAAAAVARLSAKTPHPCPLVASDGWHCKREALAPYRSQFDVAKMLEHLQRAKSSSRSSSPVGERAWRLSS